MRFGTDQVDSILFLSQFRTDQNDLEYFSPEEKLIRTTNIATNLLECFDKTMVNQTKN